MKVTEMSLKRKIAEFVIGVIIVIVIFTIFLLGLEYFAGPGVIAKFLEFLPNSVFTSIIVVTVLTYISLRRQPDERMKLILKDAAHNSLAFLWFGLPFLAILFIFMPAWNGIIAATWLWAVLLISISIFGATLAYKYWR
ncbi:MAG: hypothetical protein ACXACF_05300 [Candidatus Hermodarchaeia archaeon]|jgi:hypothetical protein